MSDCKWFFLMIREKFILFQVLRIVHLILIKVHWIFVDVEWTISLVIDSWDFSIMTWFHYVILYWESWAWTCSLQAFYIISSVINCLNWVSQEIWNLQSLFAANLNWSSSRVFISTFWLVRVLDINVVTRLEYLISISWLDLISISSRIRIQVLDSTH